MIQDLDDVLMSGSELARRWMYLTGKHTFFFIYLFITFHRLENVTGANYGILYSSELTSSSPDNCEALARPPDTWPTPNIRLAKCQINHQQTSLKRMLIICSEGTIL